MYSLLFNCWDQTFRWHFPLFQFHWEGHNFSENKMCGIMTKWGVRYSSLLLENPTTQDEDQWNFKLRDMASIQLAFFNLFTIFRYSHVKSELQNVSFCGVARHIAFSCSFSNIHPIHKHKREAMTNWDKQNMCMFICCNLLQNHFL